MSSAYSATPQKNFKNTFDDQPGRIESQEPLIISLSKVTRRDGNRVGGKNASLGELLKSLAPKGIRIPDGFAITSNAYRAFIRENELEALINDQLARFHENPDTLQEVGLAIREKILAANLSEELKSEILSAYGRMTGDDLAPASVAVRSSATAEDLPEASFAGQLETFLNITGADTLLDACRKCFASLFTDRAISYRRHKRFTETDIAVSVGVQRMVRSDKACSGVMFSIDTETGFPNVILINSAWGLGETVVQGIVDPDEFEIFKPLLLNESVRPILSKRCGAKAEKLIYSDREDTPTKLIATSMSDRTKLTLTDPEILTLARWAALIEDHYGQPMDMEWAKDGETGDLFVVQARPETVESRKTGGMLRRYRLKGEGEKLTHGLAVGDAIASAVVNRIDSAENIKDFKEGSILVTRSTDPDWAPVMKKAAAIVTDHGGRTSHAAIVSRELGLPAVIGAENATEVLSDGQTVTVSCAEGSTGVVYDGAIEFEVEEVDLSSIPNTRTEVMLNLAQPSGAFRWWRFPADGVGLVRIEFIISNLIKVHPMALLNFGEVKDKSARAEIDSLTAGYANKSDFFVDRLAQGVARIAAAFFPKPVIVRLSDFKTNEYAGLIGGAQFETREDNPMIGWRGASRYYDESYRAAFALECASITRVRNEIGLTNVKLMIPFCRTLEEADKVINELSENGLVRGENALEIYVMAEVPSNVFLAEKFAERFDGFSIGSNDLTQLTLGIDRDSERLQPLFDERNEAVKTAIESLLKKAKATNTPVGICGEAPSNYPEFTQFLVSQGINSISVSPDSFVTAKDAVARTEADQQ